MSKNSDIVARLVKLVPRLASDHAGEVVATVAALDRFLKANELDWHDFAEALQKGFQATAKPASQDPTSTPPRRKPRPPAQPQEPYPGPQTPWQAAALEVMSVALKELTPSETRFLARMLHWRGEPTPAQKRWLYSLCQRFGVVIEHD